MKGIHYPALVIDTHGWIELFEDDSRLGKWNYLGINSYRKNRKKIYILDSDNCYWMLTDVRPERPLTGLRLFLASTIYNPQVSVKFQIHQFEDDGNLIFFEALRKNIEKDDDVYTQFSEIDTILSKISADQTFKELTSALKSTGAL